LPRDEIKRPSRASALQTFATVGAGNRVAADSSRAVVEWPTPSRAT
jgi:hypothetical protein